MGPLAVATATLLCMGTTAAATSARASSVTAGRRAAAGPDLSYQVCASWKHHKRMAERISHAIESQLVGHTATVAIEVRDSYLGIGCWYHREHHFYSASAVKATILAALLRKAEEEHRRLTASEKNLAWLMITQSNNAAASALYSDVGQAGMQHFLNLAKMNHTRLAIPGYWGLTQITAHDETTLLRLLMSPGHVLNNKSRRYELRLMNNVIPSESWGVKVGVPTKFSWHIKNGWAPLPSLSDPWYVNSIGCFLYKDQGYTIVVLTHGNSNWPAGAALIEGFARAINHGLFPHARSVWPAPPINPSATAGG